MFLQCIRFADFGVPTLCTLTRVYHDRIEGALVNKKDYKNKDRLYNARQVELLKINKAPGYS